MTAADRDYRLALDWLERVTGKSWRDWPVEVLLWAVDRTLDWCDAVVEEVAP